MRAFDSDSEADDDDGAAAAGGDDAFHEGQDVGKIPAGALATAETRSLSNKSNKEEAGVIYIGHLPHGFYEHELRSYMGQFGNVTRLRVSRSKRTGGSKGYAFLEFEEESTAEVVARTMDGYLLFGHVLRVKLVPKAQVHAQLWKGANQRFKAVPWAQLAGQKLEAARPESAWTRKIDKEGKRRASRAAKLKAIDYEFEAPQLKLAATATATATVTTTTTTTETIETVKVEALKEAAPKAIEAPLSAAVVEPSNGENGKLAEAETTSKSPKTGKAKKASKGKKASKA